MKYVPAVINYKTCTLQTLSSPSFFFSLHLFFPLLSFLDSLSLCQVNFSHSLSLFCLLSPYFPHFAFHVLLPSSFSSSTGSFLDVQLFFSLWCLSLYISLPIPWTLQYFSLLNVGAVLANAKIAPAVWSFTNFQTEVSRIYEAVGLCMCNYLWIIWRTSAHGSVFPSAAGHKSREKRIPVSLIGFMVSTALSHPCTSKEVHQMGQLGQQKELY